MKDCQSKTGKHTPSETLLFDSLQQNKKPTQQPQFIKNLRLISKDMDELLRCN